MVIKKTIKYLLLPIAFILIGCPSNDCTFETKGTRFEDLAKIEPVQSTYHLGDTLTFSATISSHIENFNATGTTVNIFQETGVTETLLGGLDLVEKLKENNIEVFEGTLGTITETQVAFVGYFPGTNDYRFKVRVVFTQTGSYTLTGFNVLRMVFDAGSDCIIYSIVIDTERINQNGEFNFEVIE